MTIEPKHSIKAPKAIGPYSQAIKANGFLFISGQLPLDPASMKIIDEDASKQAKLVLSHLKAILEDSGLSLAEVVKVDLFLANMDDFKAINEVYGQFFSFEPKPARVAFEVSRLPLDVKVEISCIAAY